MSNRPETPFLAVDVVVRNNGMVLLIRRGHPPFIGKWALPGGFVERGETVETAARREAREETGLQVGLTGLLGVYSDPERDPRGHNVSITYTGEVRGGTLQAGDDAAHAAWVDPAELAAADIAFDHADILRDAGFKLK